MVALSFTPSQAILPWQETQEREIGLIASDGGTVLGANGTAIIALALAAEALIAAAAIFETI